ncbi:type II secretion system secretin GspD [Desulfobulbus rhabdoformis]|uniref:type II secretion system secretin GspD n=1 Tax=Desulfobulbus rhabdoformis TaxID=34032 RepID=UPI0019628F22|nr:type II secretion system secretin GspD [Desulfobulbus rhabdoformis]MBM9613278.1 type II secretion system secretin GspD [Desulfobulbus rhabdoformis]
MKKIGQLSLLLLVSMVIWSMGLLPAHAANPKISQPSQGAQRFVTIDFNDVDINLFIKYISELTKKNFIVDRQVQGKVTVISPTQVSAEDAYRVFESVLEVHGYAAVPSGTVVKIVPSVQARSKSIATLQQGQRATGEDRVVTQIIELKYANPDEIKAMLNPLVSKTSVVLTYTKSGMIILTDYSSNINRLLDIIKAVDVPPDSEEMVIIPLYHASAANVSKALNQLFVTTRTKRGVRAEVVKIIPFERTNTLIVFASKSSVERVRGVVAKLDADVPRREGNIHVVYLQHANAEELVNVLMNLPSESSSSTRSTSAPSGKLRNNSAPPISKEIKIVADKETNSLIITGPREDYEVVENVIKQLDIPRRMVYLEALIMEVKVSKDFNIGVSWSDGNGSVIGGFSGGAGDYSYNALNTLYNGSLPSGFTLGVLGGGITIGDVTFPNLGAVLNAYKSDDDVNVIATPQILTTDNKKASIKVGENVPYITSKNTTDSEQDYTNYEYKDVATSLTITPQVNQADIVRLEIGVEVVKLKDTETTTTPSTFTRTADTTVIVHNEETVVIGGMIGQDTTKGEYKVPVLGDIPVLGWLFKSHSNSLEKTNLYIFITPHIVENPAELADLYHKKRSGMEKLHREAGDIADQFFHPKSDPVQSSTLSDIGMQKLMQNDLLRAREFFVQALKNDAQNGAALINLGVICEREQKWKEAAAYYQRVLTLPVSQEQMGNAEAANPLKDVASTALKRLNQRGL